MAKKRTLSAEFKRDAVKLARAREGKSMSAIARDLGVSPGALCKWVKAAEKKRGASRPAAAEPWRKKYAASSASSLR